MRVHFVQRHVQDTVVILEEGNLPLPRCPRCDLQVSRKALNGRHLETYQCKKGAERKRRILAAAEVETTLAKSFHAYGNKMRAVTEFRYLRRVMTNTDDDWPVVAENLREARASWGRLARILGREGADPKVSHSFYIAVTQQVLLFGAESWVLTKRMESALEAFQGRVARRFTGRIPRRGRDGKWIYLPLAGATKEAGIVRVRTSILRRQNMVAQFIATRPILGLYEVAERQGGTRVPQRLWEQPGIDWKLAREQGKRAAESGGQAEATA